MNPHTITPWNTPKAVAVESYGFMASAPFWKKKGVVHILLKSEQMGYLLDALPNDCRWLLDGKHGVHGYPPHKWLGYSESPLSASDACHIGTSRGDLIVPAAAVLTALETIETARRCYYKNGGRIVVALLQVAIGKKPTGYAVPHEQCEACEGRGSTGDYARGTGKQCYHCDSVGAVRVTPPTQE